MLMDFHAYILYIQYIFIYLNCFLDFSECFFFRPHSLVYVSALWHQNISLLYLGTLFVPGHLYLLILPLLLFDSVMRMPERTSWKTFSTRCSFETPNHFVGLLWHWPTHCHSQLGLGVTVWCPDHLSYHTDPGVLLQHAWTGLFSTSLSYSRSRYAHSGHTRYYIWGIAS